MFKLLNRFSWLVSILFGFVILFLFFIAIDEMDGSYSILDDNYFFICSIFSIFIGMIFKKVFLSKDFIEQRVRFFADNLGKTPILNSFPLQEKEATDKVENIEEKNEYKNIPEKIKKEEVIKEEPGIISRFFSENLLAKLGGILVFLGVLFFLSLVYNAVGPVAKIIIGFAVGFSLFIVGIWLDKRGLENESKILIGVGILVNYLVILSGRYLLGDDGYLSEGTTFLFLVLNTVFAVLASIIYKSQVLLLFSFVFAYLNPLLIGGSSDNPYTLLGYTIIVSLGAFFLSYKQRSLVLLILSFLLGNLLILVSPITESIHFISVIVSLNIFNLLAISSSIIFKDKYKTILEFIFGGVFFAIAFFMFYHHNYLLNSYEFIIAMTSSLLFLVVSYLLVNKASYLYSLGTAGGVLTIVPLIATILDKEVFINVGVAGIVIFAILNWLVPFISKGFINPDDKKSITNLFIGSIFGALFLGANIYVFGEKYFPGILEGIAFLLLAIIYFVQAFLFVQKVGIEQVKQNENFKNIFYNFVGISISLFSIAIAFIFSKYPEIVSTIWLFEATLLFYFFSKTKSFKIYLIAIVLFIIGVFKLSFLIDIVNRGDFLFLISFAVIFVSLVLNIKFLSPRDKIDKDDSPYEIIHSISHIIGAGILTSLLLIIIPSTGHGWSILGISIFIFLLSFIYSYFSCKFLKGFFIFVATCFMFLQIGELESIFRRLDREELQFLKVLQYISTFIILSSLLIWKRFNLSKFGNVFFSVITSVYLLIITSLYVYDIFSNTFAVTIYWGLLSSIFLFYGIGKDLIKYRTLGLYLVSLTALKIFLYDIWFGIDDAIMRVVALIIIGVLFIVISTRYTKRFGNNMSGEFNIKNLKK